MWYLIVSVPDHCLSGFFFFFFFFFLFVFYPMSDLVDVYS